MPRSASVPLRGKPDRTTQGKPRAARLRRVPRRRGDAPDTVRRTAGRQDGRTAKNAKRSLACTRQSSDKAHVGRADIAILQIGSPASSPPKASWQANVPSSELPTMKRSLMVSGQPRGIAPPHPHQISCTVDLGRLHRGWCPRLVTCHRRKCQPSAQ